MNLQKYYYVECWVHENDVFVCWQHEKNIFVCWPHEKSVLVCWLHESRKITIVAHSSLEKAFLDKKFVASWSLKKAYCHSKKHWIFYRKALPMKIYF